MLLFPPLVFSVTAALGTSHFFNRSKMAATNLRVRAEALHQGAASFSAVTNPNGEGETLSTSAGVAAPAATTASMRNSTVAVQGGRAQNLDEISSEFSAAISPLPSPCLLIRSDSSETSSPAPVFSQTPPLCSFCESEGEESVEVVHDVEIESNDEENE